MVRSALCLQLPIVSWRNRDWGLGTSLIIYWHHMTGFGAGIGGGFAGKVSFHPQYWNTVSDEAKDLIQRLLCVDKVGAPREVSSRSLARQAVPGSDCSEVYPALSILLFSEKGGLSLCSEVFDGG